MSFCRLFPIQAEHHYCGIFFVFLNRSEARCIYHLGCYQHHPTFRILCDYVHLQYFQNWTNSWRNRTNSQMYRLSSSVDHYRLARISGFVEVEKIRSGFYFRHVLHQLPKNVLSANLMISTNLSLFFLPVRHHRLFSTPGFCTHNHSYYHTIINNKWWKLW